jgi:D-3-phosphoglycerate dehydrogenase
MKILISDAFDPSLPDRLKPFGEVTDDKTLLSEVDIVLVRSKTKCTREYIDSAPNLKLIIRGGVGLDNVDLEYAKTKGITVHNTPEASSIAVAELAFAHLLAVPNRLIEGHNSMVEGKWIKKELKRTELYGKTLGLIGIGRIGSQVAKRALAFGMKVIAYDKYLDQSEYAELKSLDEVLAQSDYISIHTPVTDETKGMINIEIISKMKDGVVIINTGRGKCVVEEDVAEALKSGKIKTYANDVWYSDPPSPDCPLLSAPNIQITPHLGASSKENLLRIGDIIVDIISNFDKENSNV